MSWHSRAWCVYIKPRHSMPYHATPLHSIAQTYHCTVPRHASPRMMPEPGMVCPAKTRHDTLSNSTAPHAREHPSTPRYAAIAWYTMLRPAMTQHGIKLGKFGAGWWKSLFNVCTFWVAWNQMRTKSELIFNQMNTIQVSLTALLTTWLGICCKHHLAVSFYEKQWVP